MMLQNFKKKTLAVLLVTAFSQSAYALNNVDCDSSNSVKGFGNWCDVGSFLGQAEPTAAGGPLFGNNNGLSATNFDSDEFGGQTQTTDETVNYNWTGYALIQKAQAVRIIPTQESTKSTSARSIELENNYELAKVGILSDYENKTIQMVIKRTNGDQIVFDQGSFIAKNKKETKFKPEGYFKVATSDGEYKVRISKGNSLPKEWINNQVTIGQIEQMNQMEESMMNPFNRSSFGTFVAGKPTDPSFIANMTQKNATYGGYGVYQVSGLGQQTIANKINVNFQESTWKGTWKGSQGYDIKAKASGSITGNNISGSVISAKISGNNVTNLSGSVNGQFSGQKAGKLIGQAEVAGNFNGLQGSAKGVFMNDKGYTPKEFRTIRD